MNPNAISILDPVAKPEFIERLADIHKCSACGMDHKRVRFIQSHLSDRLFWGVCPVMNKLVAIAEEENNVGA